LLQTPRSADEVAQLRDETVAVAKAFTPTEPGCVVNPRAAASVATHIDTRVFGGALNGRMMGPPKAARTGRSHVAVYYGIDDSIATNCEMVADLSRRLPSLSKFGFEDQNVPLTDAETGLVAVWEHELIHRAIAADGRFSGEAPHGPTFVRLVRNIFGHGWGDFAVIHAKSWLANGRDRAAFRTELRVARQFDAAYAKKVIATLAKALPPAAPLSRVAQ
jgi:hypothetical protein